MMKISPPTPYSPLPIFKIEGGRVQLTSRKVSTEMLLKVQFEESSWGILQVKLKVQVISATRLLLCRFL